MTYEYLCTACQNVWEQEQSISEAPAKVCPRCKQETAKRQVSGGAGFILKGGGWYSDLYASTPKKSGESSGDSPSGDAKKAGDSTKTGSTSGGASKETSSSSGSGSSGSGSSGSGSSGSKGGASSSAA